MWRNYLTVAVRALGKDRTYAFINIAGLVLGLAACLLLLVYVRYETGFDRWMPDSERLYQVQASWSEPGQPATHNQTSPAPIRQRIAEGFPEIEAVTVAAPGRSTLQRGSEPVIVPSLSVDPVFFDMFGLDFVDGSAATALPGMQSAVFTESGALRQFGTTDAVGRTFIGGTGENKKSYQVTGVVRDLPRDTHMKFDVLFRFNPAWFDDMPEGVNSWGAMSWYHYVKLRPGADAAAINAAFPAWEKRVIPSQTIDGATVSRADVMDLRLVNVADVHLGEAQLAAMTPGNDRRTVATFSVVAALILAMAAINFVNLATARAGQRAREVALRKVLGASRRQLIVQFLGESLLLVSLAMLLALALVELSLPQFANLVDADLRFGYWGEDGFLAEIAALVVIVGAAGGLYPALYLTRYQPAAVLKANRSGAEAQGTGRLRSLLVVAQFAISTGLIICTAIVYSQARFVETVDPGYEREGLIQIDGAWRIRPENNESARRALLSVPGVAGVARTGMGIAATNKSIQSVTAPGAPSRLNMGVYGVEPAFFETLGMRRLSGRLFEERRAADLLPMDEQGGLAPGRAIPVVINRRAALELGFGDPQSAAGATIGVGVDGTDPAPATVLGVVEDTRFRTARDQIEPLVFVHAPALTDQFVVRYRSADPAAVMEGLQGAWRRLLPDIAFDAAFAEDLIADLYAQERARAVIFAGFAILAVLISCLGLYGLAAFTAERRTKEIGIRKVLGARVRDIVRLLVWQFTRPVVIANLIAWPVAWWAMRDWLNGFDVRIALTPGPFVLAALIALGIAVGTVAGHAVRVARKNPIHALRYE